MNDELLTLTDIAELYRCTRRHARDVTTKLIGFPDVAPNVSSGSGVSFGQPKRETLLGGVSPV